MFASFEKDYIMRIVKEMVRMLLKLLFDIDTTRSMEDVIKDIHNKKYADVYCIIRSLSKNNLFEFSKTGSLR